MSIHSSTNIVRWLAFGLVAAVVTQASAQNEPFQITEVTKMTPTIDGDPAEWADIGGFDMSWAHNERSGQPDSEPLAVNIKYAWDDANFYTLITEISDDDPTVGVTDIDWCGECNGAGGVAAPWATDSVGFYDKGVKWPGVSDDPTEADILEVGPYHQYWVGLTLEEDLELDGERQYRHLVRTTNDAFNENNSARLIGPRSEENEGSLPLIPDMEELTEPQSAFSVLPGDENGGRGRRTVEFFMSWDQLRYSRDDPRDEVQERIDELSPAIEGHFREDVKAGYEFRLEPLLVDGIDDNVTYGSQTHPSGVEHPDVAHTNEWEHVSVVRLLDGITAVGGDIDGDGDTDADDIDAISAAIRLGDMASQFDVNGDGAVNNDDRVFWVTNLSNTYLGDSNLDGEFNSGDLVAAFTVGEYEDGVADNSGWADGDWNGDGEFDSSDFVTAFGEGGYEQGPRAASASVPEPTSLMLIMIGFGTLGVLRSRRSANK